MISGPTIDAGRACVGAAAKLMLLQRVGGAVADDLLTQLQPMLLIHEILRAALARPAADLDALREHSEGIKPAVQDAMSASAAAAEWLLPLVGASTPSAELASECAALLRPEFELCGLRITLAAKGEVVAIDRSQGRTMLCAVLAHAGDDADAPGEIQVRLEHRDAVCQVRVSRRPVMGAVAADYLKPQQAAMSWDDLLALAELERAVVWRDDDGAIVLELAAAAKA